MHEHRDDEIISWVPDGVMRHDDRAGGKLVTDRDHLMVMNAGRSFWHSEETLVSDPPLRMLQIIARPYAAGLEPAIQHGAIASAPENQWRHLAGPQGSVAPFHVRSALQFFDIRLAKGATASAPAATGMDFYFYVFEGTAEAGGKVFAEGEQGLLLGGGALDVTALEDSILAAFLIDPSAPVARQGTVGDHPRLPNPRWAKAAMIVLRARQWWREKPGS
jgi:redox-sensitive bicupin YhaK (pirin superfamily)